MNKCSYCSDFNFLEPPEYDHLLSFTEEMGQKNASPHIGTRCWKWHCENADVSYYYRLRTPFSGSQHAKGAHFLRVNGALLKR